MALNDPAKLLQRIPELEALADDAKIRRAIETGDPFKVYRALNWAKWLRRLPARQEMLKTLVRQRRLFVKPLNGMPALATYNSVGFRFVGKSEAEPDGTYIAVHAFVMLYLVPLIPLRSYLVQKTGNSLLSSEWQIFARAPSSLPGWLYTRCLALGMVAFVAWGAATTIIKSKTKDVVLVNGFNVAVDIELDGAKRTIPPLGHDIITVKAGDVQGSAAARGIVVDTLHQQIASSGGYSIWNIAGAAPIFEESVSYFKTAPSTPAVDPEPKVYCGQHYVEISHVDDAFTAPPPSIHMRRFQNEATRVHLDFATSNGASGISTCTAYLFARNQGSRAMRFLEAAAELSGWDAHSTYMAMFSATQASNADAIRIGQRALKARPEDVELHRRYQFVSDYAGYEAQLLREYEVAARRQPRSSSAQYLHAVLLHGHTGLAAMKKLAANFGKDPDILCSLMWRRMAYGDYAGTIQGWNALKALSPEHAVTVADAQVRALIAQGRGKEALALLMTLLDDSAYSSHRTAELLMVVNLTGGDPARVLENVNKEARDNPDFDPIRVRGGLDPVADADKQTPLVKLMLALRDDPAAALKLAPALTHADLMELGPEQWGLLYGEAARTGDQALVARLEHLTSTTTRAARDTLKHFVSGEAVSLEETDLEPGLRAAAMLVRSRNASLSPSERAQWRERATQSDLLRSVVSSALARWSA